MRSRTSRRVPPAARPAGPVRQWWLNRSVRAKGLMVVAVPLIALVITTTASLALQASERHERAVATAGFNVTNAASQVLADALNAETGIRGYVATHDRAFLAPYTMAQARIAADRKALRDAALAEGDRRQRRMLDETTGSALAGLARLHAAVAGGVPVTSLRPVLLSGKRSMDLLRRQVAGLTRGPAARLIAQRNEINNFESAISMLNIVGLGLGLLAGLAGVALFTSGISRRVVAAAANADRLGEGRPLEPVARSADDLGRLAGSLTRAQALLASRAEELMAARDEALTATAAKNAFLSSTSHELRTPLNSILGFTQLLELSDLGEEDHDSVQRILGAGRHLLALINELIDIARIESGDLSISLEPVAIRPLIEEACQLMAPLAAERSIQISQEDIDPALAVYADRQRFSQVMVNLISNAIKYNRRGGAITITCKEDEERQVATVVSDTGPGLSASELERIFVPFERLGAGQAHIEGTGIGLPLARALTEAMHGQLTAASIPTLGSAFTVTLPRTTDLVHAPAGGAAPSSSIQRSARAGATMNILYVEDNPANVEVVSRYLKNRPNTRLHAVTSGRAGLDSALRDVPDLILLDLHLPDLHGDQVLAELRAEPATAAVPVVVLSAEASPGAVRRLLAGGAAAYLTKPLDLAELGEVLGSFAPAGKDKRAGLAITETRP